MIRMRIGISFLYLIFLLVGCSHTPSLLTEVKERNLNEDVVAFINKVKATNGIYLFSRTSEKQYIIFNNENVTQGEPAGYISSIQSEIKNKTLEINIEELYSNNYDDKRLGKLRIFEINAKDGFEHIQLFKNKVETTFHVVGG